MKIILVPIINIIWIGLVQSMLDQTIYWHVVDNWKVGFTHEDIQPLGAGIPFHENSPRTPLYIDNYNSEVPLNVYHFSLNHNICIQNPPYGKAVEYFLLDRRVKGRHCKWIIQPDTTHEILDADSLFIYISRPTN
jgi:hypothetical protein